MVARTKAAPPTPWSKDLAEPQIDPTAYVHSFSKVIGDVKVGANVLVAPGTSIRADEGTPFHIGDSTNIQDGVVIHGLEQGRVTGDDSKEYSVWIGKNTCITHMALIHGPAYVGDECFIGFRSTVFNAKIGDGCIVMMHVLIQDVEIPPGKYVPSGAVITNQQQADRLPDVQENDRAFAHHVVQINEALLAGYQCADDIVCINSIQEGLNRSYSNASNSNASNGTSGNNYIKSVGDMSLSPEIITQVRSLLSQGCQISTEHANSRRFKTKSWLSGGLISAKREDQALRELSTILAEYQGEYVRLIGVDPNGKRRVAEIVVQRPGDKVSVDSSNTYTSNGQKAKTAKTNGKTNGRSSNSGLDAETLQKIRSILANGHKIGLEHANKRRFKTSSWLSVPTIESTNESRVVEALKAAMSEYSGEYVRLIGIDTNEKRRVLETIIQRPDDASVAANGFSSSSSYSNNTNTVNSNGGSSLTAETIEKLRSLLSSGYQIGTEHADTRRFKTKSWQSCSPIDSNRESEVIVALENCLREHQGEYIRMIGIDSAAKRRVSETIIQRPGNSVVKASAATSSSSSQNGNGNGNGYSNGNGNSNGRSHLSSETLEQLRSLLSSGYQIGTEHANTRRFKTKSWQSCSPIDSNRESEVIVALENCLKEHQGEYVRMIGIDSGAKRRVMETIIQRP